MRDFIYIGDVVEAVSSSMNFLAPAAALNLGTGIGTSFRGLAEAACKTLGHDAEVVNDASKPEGVFARVGDCTNMVRFYQPKVTLAQGISIVYEYHRSAGLLAASSQVVAR
jgi:nucleoside-diphosphate-sugar epimerase